MQKLKLYLSSGSVQTIPQMLDLAYCAYDLSIVKIICWYRTELTQFQLRGTNAFYIPQKYIVSPEFVNKIMEIISVFKPQQIEIHANLGFTNVELYRVLASVTRIVDRERLKIHLYDDGMQSIIDRFEFSRLKEKEFNELKNSCLHYLSTILKDETNPYADYLRSRWPTLMNYLWHHFFDVTYHIMDKHEGRLYHTVTPFQQFIINNTQTLQHASIEHTDPKTLAFCLSLLKLDILTLNKIKHKKQQENSLLYMGAGYLNAEKDNAITNKQIIKIESMKAQGIIREQDRLIFKAHPINHINNRERIEQALGNDVYTLPNSIPFEILPLIGLTPPDIICTFSTLIFTMNPTSFRHIIGNADTTSASLKNPILQALVKEKIINRKLISGWLD